MSALERFDALLAVIIARRSAHSDLADLERHEIVGFLRDRNYRPIAKLYNTLVVGDDSR